MSKYPTFKSKSLPDKRGEELEQGHYQGIHFTVTEDIGEILETLERWFDDDDPVIFVDAGETACGLNFIILEWEGYEIPSSFFTLLERDTRIADYSFYIREED